MEGKRIEMGDIIHIFVMLMVFQGSRTRHVANVWLKGNTEGDALILTCRVDALTSVVVIIGPNDKTFGKCLPPIHQHNLSKCSGNTTQDLTTNTTTLFLTETDTSMSGVWRCTHGTKTGEDWLNITIPPFCKAYREPEDCNYNASCTILIVMVILMIVIDVFIYYAHKKSLLSWCYYRILDLLGRPGETSDEKRQLIPDKLQSECNTCTHISRYALCTDCSEYFCEICCKLHIEQNPTHNIIYPQRPINKSISETEESLCRAYEIDIPKQEKPTRIRGIAILHERKVVVVDCNNKNIMAFENETKIDTYKLQDEPRGMTGVYDNKFAVTFSDMKEIRLFFIQESDSKITWEKTISLSLIGKPFSISYNSDHYAVEIGEEADGMISILDNNGEEICRIPNTGYGYFTGHTIRLCLDKRAECVYVSAMSKKEISSIKFDGSINWHIDVPSPRGVLLIPGKPVSGMNLLLASKRGNTIYQINSGDGRKTILKNDGEISGPRYIAYEPTAKLLCVQLDDCVLRIYKYIPVQVNIEIEDNI